MRKGISEENNKIDVVKIENESLKNKWTNISKLFKKKEEYVIVVDTYTKTSDIGGLPDFFCSTNLKTIKKEICNILLENKHFIKDIEMDDMFHEHYDDILLSFWFPDADEDYYVIYLYNIKKEDKINLQKDLKDYINTNIKNI